MPLDILQENLLNENVAGDLEMRKIAWQKMEAKGTKSCVLCQNVISAHP